MSEIILSDDVRKFYEIIGRKPDPDDAKRPAVGGLSGRYELLDPLFELNMTTDDDFTKFIAMYAISNIGFDSKATNDKFVRECLKMFKRHKVKKVKNIDDYADFLFAAENFKFLSDYINIVNDRSYGTARYMIISLLGKSTDAAAVGALKDLLNDETVFPLAIVNLSRYSHSYRKKVFELYRFMPFDDVYYKDAILNCFKDYTGDDDDDSEPDAKNDPDAETDAEADSEAESESESDTKPVSESGTEPEPESVPDTDQESKSDTESKSEAESDSVSEVKPDADQSDNKKK